jgi:hypothetical protein
MSHPSFPPAATIPPDDPERDFTLARSDSANLPHIGLVGDTYTILVAGKDTTGRYCLIDMHIPPGGGPPPHRHDFEEMFSVLEGEIEATFRGKKTINSSWRNHQHSSERTSSIPRQERATDQNAMLVLAGGARRVFQRNRASRRDANNTAAPTQRGGRGSVHSEGQNPC